MKAKKKKKKKKKKASPHFVTFPPSFFNFPPSLLQFSFFSSQFSPLFPCLFFPDTSAKISRSEVSGGTLPPAPPPACYATVLVYNKRKWRHSKSRTKTRKESNGEKNKQNKTCWKKREKSRKTEKKKWKRKDLVYYPQAFQPWTKATLLRRKILKTPNFIWVAVRAPTSLLN